MAERPDFQQKQIAFAAHIRDPDNVPAPEGIEDRRLAVYRELFFNNLLKLLSGTFPVLTKLHGRDRWRAMVRQFMKTHRSQTPYFLEIPGEFLAFLDEEYEAADDDFPFLVELAHYERAELEVSVSEATNDGLDVDPGGDLLDGVPVLSNLASLNAYRYPVHRISRDFIPDSPGEQPTFLVVFRRSNDDLGFMELNPVTARLFERIADNAAADERNTGNTGETPINGRALLLALADEIGYTDREAFVEHGLNAMREMRDNEILLGVARSH